MTRVSAQPPAAASPPPREGAPLVSYLNYDVCRRYLWQTWRPANAGAGGGIRTPDRLITNQLLYRTELRQPDKKLSLAQRMPREQTSL